MYVKGIDGKSVCLYARLVKKHSSLFEEFSQKISSDVKKQPISVTRSVHLYLGAPTVASYRTNGQISCKCKQASFIFDDTQEFRLPKTFDYRETAWKYWKSTFFRGEWYFFVVYWAHLAWVVYQCYLFFEGARISLNDFLLTLIERFQQTFGGDFIGNLGKIISFSIFLFIKACKRISCFDFLGNWFNWDK